MTGPGGLGLTAGQTEPRWPGQQRLDRVAQVGSNMAARGREWNPGGQVNDGWTVWPKRVAIWLPGAGSGTQGARSTMVGPCGPRGLAWCSLVAWVRLVYWILSGC